VPVRLGSEYAGEANGCVVKSLAERARVSVSGWQVQTLPREISDRAPSTTRWTYTIEPSEAMYR
jgi:hypothetical protein